jgi:hypothetical protein
MNETTNIEQKYFSDFDIDVGNKISGQITTTCPKCSNDRKKKTDKCLSINLDERVWNCHHCGWTGGLNGHSKPPAQWENKTGLSDKTVEWFLKRNISQQTLIDMKITEGREWMPQVSAERDVICFNYFRDGQLINTKYRDIEEKNFKLVKDAELILYNLDGIRGQKSLYIVEGEVDAHTMIGQGWTNTVSVPNGASPKNNNLKYINLDDFKDAEQIFIATDDDEPGNKLAQDLADHLGIERCKRVTFGGYKDVNEMFCKEGGLEKLGFGKFLNEETKHSDWKALQIISEPPEETPLITIGNSPVATAGNYSQVIGKKKSRKTLFLTWLVSQYAGDIESDVLLFDTEQGTRHVWKVMDRIKRLTGHTVGTFYLRGKSPEERKAIIQAVVAEYPTRPKLIIIDGIRDLLSNINDPDQVSELLTWLEKITLDNGLHVVNVLHMNKTDNNARGHLGSELLNKSEVTIELERDEQADCTIVKCESSRDIPFDPFAFRHDINGLPEIVGLPTAGKVLPDTERKDRLRFIFQDNPLVKYAELIEGIKQNFEVGTNKAKSMTAEFNRTGWLVKNGKDGKDVHYKCMV